MNPLSRQARTLLDAARTGTRLPAGERGRLRAMVFARVGLAAAGGAAAAAPAAAAAAQSSWWLVKIGLASFLAGALTIGAASAARVELPPPARAGVAERGHEVLDLSPRSSGSLDERGTESRGDDPPEPARAASLPAAAALGPPTGAVAAPAADHSAAPSQPAHASSPAPPPPGLDDEIRALREAQLALGRGEPARAIEVLDAHAAAHPEGVLEEERRAARLIASCQAGRGAESRAEAERFALTHASSPLAERVRRACVR